MPNAQKHRQELLLILAAVLVIGISVVATLLVSRPTGELSGSGGGGLYQRDYSLEEAEKSCEAHARKVLGKRLQLLTLDDHSTRTDAREARHKVFFVAELYEDSRREGVPGRYFVNCQTHLKSLEVTAFQVAQDSDYHPPAVKAHSGGDGSSAFF